MSKPNNKGVLDTPIVIEINNCETLRELRDNKFELIANTNLSGELILYTLNDLKKIISLIDDKNSCIYDDLTLMKEAWKLKLVFYSDCQESYEDATITVEALAGLSVFPAIESKQDAKDFLEDYEN